MPGKKKPFIDKNRSVTFRLVHRSQKDPFIADSECGERVLAPIPGQRVGKSDGEGPSRGPFLKRREELVKYGIYFDDDYDYLQHLRDANEVVSMEPIEQRAAGSSKNHGERAMPNEGIGRDLQLPATLFECRDVELKVGLLNQAAPTPGPRPDLDPDIVALLDDEEGQMEYEELEDDFVVKANESLEDGEAKERPNSESGDRGEDEFSVEGDYDWNREETRSRFTEYSLTSSIIHRTQGLQQLDARFEKIYEQYDDSDASSLESNEEASDASSDEGDGGLLDMNSQRMLEMAEEFQEEKSKRKNWAVLLGDCTVEDLRPRIITDDEDQLPMERIGISDKGRQWDCESIISTYSNIYNHPTLIKEERPKKVQLDPKTGRPREAFQASGLTRKNLEQLIKDDVSVTASMRSVASVNARPKEESAEEKRLRKQTVKMERRERRFEKKANKAAFKDEKIRQKTVDMNLKQNMQGLKLS